MRVNAFAAAATCGVICIGLVSSALADNCSGRFTNVTQSSETTDLGNGHTITIFSARGSATSENSALNVVGQCGGYVITLPDGKIRLGYACARKDQNGNSYSDYGTMEPGADKGSWTQAGGTGVFAGKKNSGWWQPVAQDGKTTMGTWTGNCE